MGDLFNEIDKETRAVPVPGAMGPVMVSDSTQIIRLVREVLDELKAKPEEVAMWAGNRTRVNEEVPWIVEQVVGAQLTESRFKMMVAGAVHPKQHGTFIHGLSERQYSGVWKIASYEVAPGTIVRMDGVARRGSGKMGDAEDDIKFVGSNVDTDQAPQVKTTVRWVIRWIDAAGAAENRYDIHGQPIKAIDLTPESVASLGGGMTNQVLAALAEGQTKMANAVDKLAGATAPAPAPRGRPGRKPKAEKVPE